LTWRGGLLKPSGHGRHDDAAREACRMTGAGTVTVETLQRLLAAFNALIWTR
jgi:hypothetical protein